MYRFLVGVIFAELFVYFVFFQSFKSTSTSPATSTRLQVISTKFVSTPPVSTPTTFVLPSSTPRPTTLPTRKPSPRPTDSTPWGIATQISEHTYTMKIQMDDRMATAEEILNALNAYRQRLGSQKLTLDPNLVAYAQSRADYFVKIGGLDEHKGFMDYLENQNGHDKIGFDWLGENISYGYKLSGTHLIEWVYAGDKPHDDNQRDNRWNYVGIGVNGTATCLIFGTGKH